MKAIIRRTLILLLSALMLLGNISFAFAEGGAETGREDGSVTAAQSDEGEAAEEPAEEPIEESAEGTKEVPAEASSDVEAAGEAEEPVQEPAKGGSVTAKDDYRVPFIDENGNLKYLDEFAQGYSEITAGTQYMWGNWSVAYGSVTVSERITVRGNAYLILRDGASMTASKGIYVEPGASLTIYAQSAGSGMLTATASGDNAGIGGNEGAIGGDVFIYGGIINATGGNGDGAGIGGGEDGDSGNITIGRGTVTANGGSYAAGIGGGKGGSQAGTVTITGGTVSASSSDRGAGIGGGYYSGGGGAGGNVVISGGSVTASSVFGAGIGGGRDGNQNGTVTISGGEVTATSEDGMGIGGGRDGQGGTVNINGGKLHAKGKMALSLSFYKPLQLGDVSIYDRAKVSYSLSQGSSPASAPAPVVIVDDMNWNDERVEHCKLADEVIIEPCVEHEAVYYITNDTHHSVCRYCGYSVEPETAHSYDSEGVCTLCGHGNGSVGYVDEAGNQLSCNEYTEIRRVRDEAGVSFSNGWYVLRGEISFNNRINVKGRVDIILSDGAELKANDGIHVSKADGGELNIWSQAGGSGKLTATAAQGREVAGIGADPDGAEGGPVTIYGGTVTAQGGRHGAGIGGSKNSAGGAVVIKNGSVTARGGDSAAGIGGGDNSEGVAVSIFGGVVSATGGDSGAGIGGGEDRNGGIVTISGGSVTADGGSKAAGIGGGYAGSQGGKVSISGGQVAAAGGSKAAGIGGGCYYRGGADGGEVEITGGRVSAKAGTNELGGENPTAIGKGGDSRPADRGTLTVFDRAKVSYGTSENALSAFELLKKRSWSQYDYTEELNDDRADTCLSYPCAVIETCTDHNDFGYINSRSGKHEQRCRYCGLLSASSDHSGDDCGVCTVCGYDRCPVRRYNTDGSITEIENYTDVADIDPNTSELTSGWYVVRNTERHPEPKTLNNRLNLAGDVRILLCDGAKLTARKGIRASNGTCSLSVYGQSENSGELQADAEEYNAGIGGNRYEGLGVIYIFGGRVVANGGKYGAGIGGGDGANQGGSLYVEGGSATARGGQYAAGIGGGDGGNGGDVTVVNGGVTAIGGVDAAGIGGGEGGAGGIVSIKGRSLVTASSEGSNSYGAGIGGGEDGNGGFCFIDGGTVSAFAGSGCSPEDRDGGTAIGPGEGYNKPSDPGARNRIYDSAMVAAGAEPVNPAKAVNNDRLHALMYSRYIKAEPCDHTDARYVDMGRGGHARECSYCVSRREETEPHVYTSSGVCMICRATTNVVNVYIVEQDTDGTWTRPESHQYTAVGSYIVEEQNNFSVAGYSEEFSASTEGRTAVEEGETIELGEEQTSLYVYYERKTYNLKFYKDIAGTKIASSEMVAYQKPLSDFSDRTASQADSRFAGWSVNPRTEGSYHYWETVPDSDPDKPQEAKDRYPYVLYDFSGTMPDYAMELYPVFVQDRLEVHLDLGASDSEMDSSQDREFTVEINENIDMTIMNNATRAGYELAGWYTRSAVRWEADRGATPEYCDRDDSGNLIKQTNSGRNYDYYTLTLTAGWTPKTINAVFDVGEHAAGASPAEIQTALGSMLTLPTLEAQDDYIFLGWKDKNDKMYSGGQELLFDDWSLTEKVGGSDVLNFTAVYRERPEKRIIYLYTDGGSYMEPIEAEEGSQINEPAEPPTRAGYTFAGWYLQDGTEASFPITIGDSDITLKAHWSVISYTLTFNATGGHFSGGSDTRELSFSYGDSIPSDQESPVKDHHSFAGWGPAVPEVMPAENVTVYAIWTPVEYTMTFDAGGGSFSDGSSRKEVKGIYDSIIEAPQSPEKGGSRFDGWYLDDETEIEFPAHMPGADTTVTAHWHEHDTQRVEKENEIAPTCTRPGSYVRVAYCSVCGTEMDRTTVSVPAKGHDWDEWVTVKAATTEKAGLKSRVCRICEDIETAEIPVIVPGGDTEPSVAETVIYVMDLKPVKGFKAAKGRKKITAKWKKAKKKVLKTYGGYEIQYSTTKTFDDPLTKYAGRSAKKKQIKKLKKKQKYYVRMRAYRRDGNVIHISKWTKVKKVRVK